MKKFSALLTMIALTGCAETIATVDTFCTVTTRYHASPEQIAAFKHDRPVWESLVNWLSQFNRQFDERCLKASD